MEDGSFLHGCGHQIWVDHVFGQPDWVAFYDDEKDSPTEGLRITECPRCGKTLFLKGTEEDDSLSCYV